MRLLLGLIGAVVIACVAAAATVGHLAGRDVRAKIQNLEAQRRIADTARGLVEYAIEGEGPPVLIVHGAGGGFDQGLLFAEAFVGDAYQWIAPSRFGYLGSPLPTDSSTAAQADAFAALLDELGVERVAIVAVSGGAPPALQFAERHADRTLGLVLISSAPFTPHGAPQEARPMPDWLYQALFGNDVVFWALWRAAPQQLRLAFDARPELLKIASDEERRFVDRVIDAFLPASRRVNGIANEIAAIDPSAKYALDRITARTLVLHAKDDGLNPFHVALDLPGRITNATLREFENGGHLLLGRHAEVRRDLRDFLGVVFGVENSAALRDI